MPFHLYQSKGLTLRERTIYRPEEIVELNSGRNKFEKSAEWEQNGKQSKLPHISPMLYHGSHEVEIHISELGIANISMVIMRLG